MPKIRNIETGEIQDVTEDQLGVALTSGQYEPEQGSRVLVVDNFGDMSSIGAEDLLSGAAEQSGMRIATPQEIAKRRREKEYGEGIAVAQAAGEGLLRGATIGFSDAALKALGVSAEGIRARKEENPWIAGGTEAAGVVGSVLATGGLGGTAQATGRGALAAGRAALQATPAAMVARGAMAAERGLAQLIGRSVGGRALTMGLTGAAEGALYGVGEAVSESALGDHELTAERVLASAGHGALWGGATAGILSALGSGIGAAARKVRPKTALETALEKAPLRAEESIVIDLAKARAVVNDIPASGAQKGMMARALNSADDFVKGRRALRGLDETRNAIAEDITRRVSRLEEIRDAALNDLTIAKKTKAIGKAMREEAPAPAETVASFVEDSMVKTKEKLQVMADNKFSLHSRYEKSLVKAKLDGFDERLLQIKKLARSDNVVDAGEEMFGILDQVKRDIGDIADALEGTKYENRLMGKDLRNHYMKLRDDLTNDNIWGTQAANIQRADNAAWSTDLDVKSPYNRFFLSDAGGRKKASGFGQVRVGDMGKIKSAIRNADSDLDLNNSIMRRSVKAQAELLEQLSKSHADIDVGTHALVDEAKELSAGILAKLDEAAGVSQQAKGHKKILDAASDIPIWGQLVKTLAWAADQGYRADSALLNNKIQNTLRTLAGQTVENAGVIKRINQRTESVRAVAQRAADNFFKKGKRLVVPLTVTQYDKGETLNDRYNSIIKRHDEILSNPGLLAERSSQLLDSTITPNTNIAFSNAAARAAAFLKSKQPTPNTRPSDIFAHLSDRQRVADSEIAKYMRYVDGVEHPVDAIEQFGKTGYMPRETAEAIRTVYPKMYAKFEMSIMDHLISAEEPPPYEDLMRLSMIFDRPLHPSLEGEYIAMCQDTYTQDMGDKLSPSRRAMPDTSKNYLSPSQRLAV